MSCLWYFTITVFYCLYFGSYPWTDNMYDRLNHAVIVFKTLKKIRSFDYSYSVVIIIFSVRFRNLPRLVKIVIPTVMLIYLSTVTSYFTVLTPEEMTAHRWFGVVSFFYAFVTYCVTTCSNYELLFHLFSEALTGGNIQKEPKNACIVREI